MAAATRLLATATEYFGPFQRIPIPVHSMGPDGLLLEVNEAWVDYTGYSKAQAIGRSFAEFLDPASASLYRQKAVPELIDTVPAKESRSVEYRLIKASGEIADIVLTARPERDPATGRFLHSLTVINDITARNRAEAALRQAQKLEALGSLTGGVAHDFNNLLMIILGSLQLLAQAPARRGCARRAAGGCRAAGGHARRRADHQTAGLRAPAGTDAGSARSAQAAGVPAPDAGPIARSRHPHRGGPSGGSVESSRRSEPARTGLAQPRGECARCDAGRRPPAPDRAQRHRRDRETAASSASAAQPAAPAGEYVVLTVSDTGIGMDEAALARAADPFFTTKGPGKGTGLGLSMVHGFAVQSGGALLLSSRPGAGTTVELWLPRTTEAGPRSRVVELRRDDLGRARRAEPAHPAGR